MATVMTPRRLQVVMAVLIAIAIIERFAWALRRGLVSQAGEAHQVAIAFAEGRGFSDPYFFGSEPIAHLLPTQPLLAAFVYSAFGTQSIASKILLQTISCGWMTAGYLLFFRMFKRLGVPLVPRLAAFAFLCVIPLFMGPESLDFRYWEGGLAVVLAIATLDRIVRFDSMGANACFAARLDLAALLAATVFVNAAVGLGLGLCAVIMASRRWTMRRRLETGAVSAVLLAMMVVPWALRNDAVLGKPVLLRSNAALELSVANNDIV